MISLNDMQDLSDEQIIGKVLEDNKDIYRNNKAIRKEIISLFA